MTTPAFATGTPVATLANVTGLSAGIPVAFPDATDPRVTHWGETAVTAPWHDGPAIPVVIEYTTLATGYVSYLFEGNAVSVELTTITLL